MQRTFSSELSSQIDKPTRVRGWLHTTRALGKINFLILRDKEGLLQVVIEDKEQWKKIQHLQVGSILSITGKVAISSSDFGYEIIHPTIDVEVPILEAPPIEYYKPEILSDLEFILDHRPISLRNRKIQAVFRIQGEIAHAYRLFMHDTIKASEYFGPNLLGASTEGGAEFFHVDYFGYDATLAQSSQLYKQIMVGVNERVFAIMPFFRAENSNTPRHLTEGKQLEFEMGFFDHWHAILDIQEGCIKYIVQHLKTNCAKELELLKCSLVEAPDHVPFPKISFQEAQEIFFQRTGIDERKEPDLSPAAEKELCRFAKEKFGTDLIFIIDWQTKKRPFYAYPKEDNPELSNTFDLLCAGTEITSGGQRRHTYPSMIEGIQSKGMNPESFVDYLSIFRYGMPAHGGFGMGLERLTLTLLELKNIREASLFPSDPKRIACNRIKAKIFFGGENIRNEIIRLLRQESFLFEHQTAANTSSSIDKAIKSLILKGKSTKKNYLVNLPANLKIDMKAFADIVQEKCEMEDPVIIQERFGLPTGTTPPFGNLLNLETYFDENIKNITLVSFFCAVPSESISMNSKDLITLIQPKFGSFSKN
jgi:nondiscriminating aspartyl-tRNA synthetase